MPASDLISAPSAITPPKRRWAAAVRGEPEQWDEFASDYALSVYAWLRASGCDREPGLARTHGFFAWVEAYIPTTEVAEARVFLYSHFSMYLGLGGPVTSESRIVLPPVEEAEERVADVVENAPDMAFAKVWTRTVLGLTIKTVQAEYAAAGKGNLFPFLKPFLAYHMGDNDPYTDAAPKAGLSLSAMKLAVFHFRQRYRDVLRATVMDTLVTNERTDEELTALLCAAT
jgi:hypothetical protein